MTTSFENSAMKSSFSLSSLRSPPAPPSSGRCEQLERPYHSLNKKRKEPWRESWRRSWGSAASGGSLGDDLWPLLQHHYDYIMDKQIIDTCHEANGELLQHNTSALLHTPPFASTKLTRQWSLSQLVAEFTELCQWMSHVQEEIYSSPEHLASRKLRMDRMCELTSLEPRRAKFIEQAAAISQRIPEATAEVDWRVEHLNTKWEGLKLLLTPDQENRDDSTDTVDKAHEVRCLRRWLHVMEGRLPPPSLACTRWPYHRLLRTQAEHQVLQRDVECHGRIVSSVVKLCSSADSALALERRWQLLYLRAIEWQCHLEACLAKIDNQCGELPAAPPSDSDDEPVLKQPRLCRRRSPRRVHNKERRRNRNNSEDSRQSCSDEDREELAYSWGCVSSESEPESVRCRVRMSEERRVPSLDTERMDNDQTVPGIDQIDGMDLNNSITKTPQTVIKRKKPVDSAKFNQNVRKSNHCATFYFKHHDTDSDRQMITDEKSQSESSEEEWTYVGTKIANEDSTDLMTSSIEITNETPAENDNDKPASTTPDLIKVDHHRSLGRVDIERLVMQADELVKRKAMQQQAMQKMEIIQARSLKVEMFEAEGKSSSRAKMSRIKEWLNQSSEGKNDNDQQGTESYDASGEYTTESEVDTSLTSDERNIHSSMDMSMSMSTSTCTVTPTHQAKVQLRKKRSSNSSRPWSVSCLSQLSSKVATTTQSNNDISRINMSNSESALNTLASPQGVTPATSNYKLRGSSTTVQGHVSSTNTMTEACTSCVENNDKQCWLRRKRAKLRRRDVERTDRLVKSRSFCGRLTPEVEDKNERSTASDPATSKKNRFDTTSTSGNDSDGELIKQQLTTIANLQRSIEKTHISTETENLENEQTVAPSFKLGPAGGPVRPRIATSVDRERALLGLSLGDPNEMWGLGVDKDSDVDRSINTAGTEDHSSFSEQAWDFYQEKYNSEPYSEAPDSDAARRLLEFGDDYRMYLDSQSDCCSSLSAQPEEHSPNGTRRRKPLSDNREKSLPRHKRPTKTPEETPTRKPKKHISSAERKKSLLDSLERSRNNTSLDSNEGVRRRKQTDSNKKRSPEFDLLNIQALSRRRHNSNLTSDEVNSSLEYTEVNNRPDILDSLTRRRKNEEELTKVALTELRRRSTESCDSDESSSPKKHSRRNHWSGDSDSESEEVKTLVRRSSAQLEASEAALSRQDASPDLLRDYSDIVARCRENINLLEATLAGHSLSSALQRDIRDDRRCFQLLAMLVTKINTQYLASRHSMLLEVKRLFKSCKTSAHMTHMISSTRRKPPQSQLDAPTMARDLEEAVSARWSALRAAATRRGGARRLRREIEALRVTLDDICEPGDDALQPHTRAQLHRRIDELKDRLSRLLECKVSMLKLTVSVRKALSETDGEDTTLSNDLAALCASWDDAHQRTSTELLSLEKAICAWAEWESALRELQGALRGDQATLQALTDRGGDQTEVANKIRQLAASLIDKKKGGSTCDSLSDSGISDGDSEGAGGRARRLSALRELARRLQAALAPNSPAHRAITKRMEQTENEVRTLQEKCRVLVEGNIPDLKMDVDMDRTVSTMLAKKTGSGDPDYNPRRGWVWRVLKSSIPIQICLVALLLAAWLIEKPNCCDAINTLTQTFTPQLRYVRGNPPV